VQSYRDLPLKLNQWNNVVRWEKRTYFFLRTTEFLWQEAHTAHATHDESWKMTLDGVEAYRKFVEEYLAIPVIKGKKSQTERFAGAEVTTTIEAMMPDGKALQAGTSHDLGQHFSKATAFNISFQDNNGEKQFAWQVSFGLSTRIIGAIIMTHGDDDGLVLPPKIAPTQVTVVAAQKSAEIETYADSVMAELKKSGIRARYKQDSEHSLGWKLNQNEVEGTPVVLIVGQQELANATVTAHIRAYKGTELAKKSISRSEIAQEVPAVLNEVQEFMLAKAQEKTASLTTEVSDYPNFVETMKNQRGFIKAFWCEDALCEKTIKDDTKASTRCLPFSDQNGHVLEENGSCIQCGKPATHRWLFAQAY